MWNDSERFKDVTETIIDNISTVYKENAPDFIYFVTLYNIFNEFLEDISEDVLPNEAIGFKNSVILGIFGFRSYQSQLQYEENLLNTYECSLYNSDCSECNDDTCSYCDRLEDTISQINNFFIWLVDYENDRGIKK